MKRTRHNKSLTISQLYYLMKETTKNLSFIICCALIPLLNSCNNWKEEQHCFSDARSEYSVGVKGNRIRISDFSGTATIIPLDSMAYIRGVDKILYEDSLVYVLDQQRLFCFDLDSGQLHFLFDRQGRSKNEYIKIIDVDINRLNGDVYLLCMPNKIIELSPDLNIKHLIELDDYYDRIAVVNEKIYLYSYYNHQLDLYAGNHVEKLMNLPNTPAWVFGESPVFHNTPKGLFFTPEPFASVFKIEGDTIEHLIHFNHKNEEEIAKRLRSKNLLIGMENLNYPFPKINDITLINNLMAVTYTFGIRVRICVIDLTSNQLVNDGILSAINPFPNKCYGNSLYAARVLSPEMIEYDTLAVHFNYKTPPARTNEQLAIFEYQLNQGIE